MKSLARLVHTVADFPRPGVLFRDLTPLLADADAFSRCVEALAEPWRDRNVQTVCGVDARGFIFGAALAPPRCTAFWNTEIFGNTTPRGEHHAGNRSLETAYAASC
jgi:hypothetical protein